MSKSKKVTYSFDVLEEVAWQKACEELPALTSMDFNNKDDVAFYELCKAAFMAGFHSGFKVRGEVEIDE